MSIPSSDPQCEAVLADNVARCELPKSHDGDHGACLGYVEIGDDVGDSGYAPGDCLDWVEW